VQNAPTAEHRVEKTPYDVIVAGGGHAALCAAICAREQGANVLLLEAASASERGGNSRHTRNCRCMHGAPTDVLHGVYSEDEYYDDLVRVTGGSTDERLARLAILESEQLTRFLRKYGVRFQPPLAGTLHLGRTNAFFLGGGKALINKLFAAAQRLGVRVLYEAKVEAVLMHEDRFEGVIASAAGERAELHGKTLIAASGGFESNLAWLREAWGEGADNFIVRGTVHNTGVVLKSLLDQGVQSVGDPTQCHAVAIDARSPKFDGGIVTRVDCVSLGIVVNRAGRRFYDEGEDLWPKRYAIWGRLIAAQPDQLGYSIIDAKAVGHFMPTVFPPVEAASIRELAGKLGIPGDALVEEVDRFNRAVQPGTFDQAVLDDCRTLDLRPDKTHWARRIDTPPYRGYPLRPGITFTYLGVAVNDRAKVLMCGGSESENIYAAGEIMAGNILGKGYLAGIGMTIGGVFGRIAGSQAGAYGRD
jgi:tricarballylate dehydrogenase